MAIEVELDKYLHDGSKTSEIKTEVAHGAARVDPRDRKKAALEKMTRTMKRKVDDCESSDEEGPQVQEGTLPVCRPPFRHNPLHDLESLLWLALYIILCSDMSRWDTSLSEQDWARYLLARRKLAANLFNNPTARLQTMMRSNTFQYDLAQLHPLLRAICEQLNTYREYLVELYISAEARMRDDTARGATRQQDTAGTSGAAGSVFPRAIPYSVAFDADFYAQAEDTFRGLRKNKAFRSGQNAHITFKSRTSLLSDQQREMVALLEAAEGPPAMPTIHEEGEDADEGPPRKSRRLDGPSPEQVDAARSRNQGLQHPRVGRATVSDSVVNPR